MCLSRIHLKHSKGRQLIREMKCENFTIQSKSAQKKRNTRVKETHKSNAKKLK
jgi:hypothetical protein